MKILWDRVQRIGKNALLKFGSNRMVLKIRIHHLKRCTFALEIQSFQEWALSSVLFLHWEIEFDEDIVGSCSKDRKERTVKIWEQSDGLENTNSPLEVMDLELATTVLSAFTDQIRRPPINNPTRSQTPTG